MREYPLPAIVYDVLVDLCIDEQDVARGAQGAQRRRSGDGFALRRPRRARAERGDGGDGG
jgi:hypothetical protein